MDTKLLDSINDLSLEVFRIYNRVIRTPLNWKEEKKRLKNNPNSRAVFLYEKVNLTKIEQEILFVKSNFLKEKTMINKKGYFAFLEDVVMATINNALIKIKIINNLSNFAFQPTLDLRRSFYQLPYNYKKVVKQFERIKNKEDIINVGKELGKQELVAEEAAGIVKKSLNEIVSTIDQVIIFPREIKKDVLKAFTAQVEVVNDPSFSMRCITDPKTLVTKILINKNRKYSQGLLKIAFLHEFCGHALEMAVFDGVFVKKGVLPKIFGYAGVSSPNIFDVKAEVLADLMVEPFVTNEEARFVRFRRNAWLVCRAMADYLYNIKGGRSLM